MSDCRTVCCGREKDQVFCDFTLVPCCCFEMLLVSSFVADRTMLTPVISGHWKVVSQKCRSHRHKDDHSRTESERTRQGHGHDKLFSYQHLSAGWLNLNRRPPALKMTGQLEAHFCFSAPWAAVDEGSTIARAGSRISQFE